MSARGDARKRLAEEAAASPISMRSDAHNGLTEAEREELWLVEHAPIEATYTAVARIKAEAVQAERELIAWAIRDVVLNPESRLAEVLDDLRELAHYLANGWRKR